MAGDQTERLTRADAEALLTAALRANDIPDGAARSVSRALVAAETEGQVGHGFSRLEDYVAQARSGKVVANARPEVSRPSPGFVHVDAGYGFAYPALDAGLEAGIPVARELGMVAIGIRRSHHCGALSVQVEKAARAGLVALMVANSPPAMAPWGGRSPFYGTNPIAFAAPVPDAPPLVIDLSLSRVARGKVMNAHKTGQAIPEGWALDAHGQPTRDPEAALAGSMLPIGGAKGTALALMVEVLSSVMTGATLSVDAGSFFSADGPRPGVGQFLTLWSPPEGAEAFGLRMTDLVERLESFDAVRLPGSRRAAAIAEVEQAGLSVPRRYVETARALARAEG